MQLPADDLQWSARRMQTAAAWAHSIRQTVDPGASRSDQRRARGKRPKQQQRAHHDTQTRSDSVPQGLPVVDASSQALPLLDAHFLPDWLKARPEYTAVRAGGHRAPRSDASAGQAASSTSHSSGVAHSGELLFVKQALHTPSQMRGPKEMALLQRWLRQQRRFAYLRPAQLSTVARSMTLQQSPPGTPVHSGGSAVYFVLEGTVTIRQWASKHAKEQGSPPRTTVTVPPGVGFGKHSGWQRLTSRLASAASGKGGVSAASRRIQGLLLKAKGAAARLRVARLASPDGAAGDSASASGSSDGEPDPNEVPPVVDAPLPLLLAGRHGRTKTVHVDPATSEGGSISRSHIAHAVVERQRLMGSLREMVFFDPEVCEAEAGDGDAQSAVGMQTAVGARGGGGVTAADEGGAASPTAAASSIARGDTTQVARLGDMEFATAWALQREGAVKALLAWLTSSGLSILADCSSTRVKSLAGVLEERTYPPGTTLFRQGDVARALVILKSGHADCTLQTVTRHVQSWPTAADSWEQVRSTQRHQRILGKVGPCVILGHECVLNMPQYSPAPRMGEAPQFDAVARRQGGAGGGRRPSAATSPTSHSPLSPGGGFVSTVFQSMAVGVSMSPPPVASEPPLGSPPSPATEGARSADTPTPNTVSSPQSPISHFSPSPVSPGPSQGAGGADRGVQSAARLARVAQLLAPPPSRPKGISRDMHLPARRAFSLVARDHATVLVLPVHRVFDVLQSSATLARLGVAAEMLVWAQYLAKQRDELYAAEDAMGTDNRARGTGHTQAGRSELLSGTTVSKLRQRLQGVRGRHQAGERGVSSDAQGSPPSIMHSALFPEPDEVDLRSGQLLLPLAIQPHTYLGAVARPASAADGTPAIQNQRDRACSRQSSRETASRQHGEVSAAAGAMLQSTTFVTASPVWPSRPRPGDAASSRGAGDSIFKSVPSVSTAAARRREEAQRRRILAACVGDRYGKTAGLRHEGRGHNTELPEWSRDVRALVQQSAAGLVPSLMAPPSLVALATLLTNKGGEGGLQAQAAGGDMDTTGGTRRKPANVVATAAAALRGAAAHLTASSADTAGGGTLTGTQRTVNSSHTVDLRGYAMSHTPGRYRGHLSCTPGQLEAQAQEASFRRSVAERRAERKRKRQARKWQRTHERGKLMGVLAHAKNVPAAALLQQMGFPSGAAAGGSRAARPGGLDVSDIATGALLQERMEGAYGVADRLLGIPSGAPGDPATPAKLLESPPHALTRGEGGRTQQRSHDRRTLLQAAAAEEAASLRSQVREAKMQGTLHALRQLPQHTGGAGPVSTSSGKQWHVSQLAQLASAQRQAVLREASPHRDGGGVQCPAHPPAAAVKSSAARRRIMAALDKV